MGNVAGWLVYKWSYKAMCLFVPLVVHLCHSAMFVLRQTMSMEPSSWVVPCDSVWSEKEAIDNYKLSSFYMRRLPTERFLLLNKKNQKLKIPLCVNIFIWFLNRGVILTKKNLSCCSWQGSKTCVFCQHDECIKHLFRVNFLVQCGSQLKQLQIFTPTLCT